MSTRVVDLSNVPPVGWIRNVGGAAQATILMAPTDVRCRHDSTTTGVVAKIDCGLHAIGRGSRAQHGSQPRTAMVM